RRWACNENAGGPASQAMVLGNWSQPTQGPLAANVWVRSDARRRAGSVREVMATGVKRATVGLEEAVHVDHRACLPDPVRGLHNVSLRCIWPFDAALRRGVQNGARPVQILRDGGRTDIRWPCPDRYRAGPAAAAADP